MAITAAQVNELRQKTGVGLMDCKKALVAANGDMDAAMENLRKSGIAKADKKAGRAANDGLFVSIIDGKVAVAVEVLCETDFVARTDDFQALAADIAKKALTVNAEGDISAALNDMCGDAVKALIGKLGENMQIRRAVRFQGGDSSTFAGYHHMDGRVSVLVEFEGEVAEELKKDICMHIAAFSPRYVCSSEIPAAVIDKEKEIALAADPKLAGKPAQMLEKILAGKINRFYADVCLMNQPWVRDDKTCLAKVAPNLKIKRFVRWMVGEEL